MSWKYCNKLVIIIVLLLLLLLLIIIIIISSNSSNSSSIKEIEVRDRLAHTTGNVVKKARCACTHDVIQDGAENADERRKNLLQSLPQYHKIPNYHRIPKFRMRSPNVERNKRNK